MYAVLKKKKKKQVLRCRKKEIYSFFSFSVCFSGEQAIANDKIISKVRTWRKNRLVSVLFPGKTLYINIHKFVMLYLNSNSQEFPFLASRRLRGSTHIVPRIDASDPSACVPYGSKDLLIPRKKKQTNKQT